MIFKLRNTFFPNISIYYNKSIMVIIFIGNVRSISALDTAAVQRARARQQYSTMARLKVTAGTASLRKYYTSQSQ